MINKGALARYRIPPFKPRPASSPSCDAVLEQMEHCAMVRPEIINEYKVMMNILPAFFMLPELFAKLTLKMDIR